jgi:hypothetical protein
MKNKIIKAGMEIHGKILILILIEKVRLSK